MRAVCYRRKMSWEIKYVLNVNDNVRRSRLGVLKATEKTNRAGHIIKKTYLVISCLPDNRFQRVHVHAKEPGTTGLMICMTAVVER